MPVAGGGLVILRHVTFFKFLGSTEEVKARDVRIAEMTVNGPLPDGDDLQGIGRELRTKVDRSMQVQPGGARPTHLIR